jgi:hypothetical protein
MDPVVIATLRFALVGLFVWTAWHKLRAPAEFVAAVRAYRLVPEVMSVPVAGALVMAEMGTAISLLTARSSRAGAALAAALLGLYATAIAVNLARGRRDLDCGCAGPGARRPVSEALVLRNLVLLAAAIALWWPPAARAMTGLDVTTVVAAATALAALYAGVERLLANLPAIARIRGVT